MKKYIREVKITLQKNKTDLEQIKISSSRDSANFFIKQFGESIEVFESVQVIFLDNSLNSLGWMKVSQGGLNQSIVDVRLIFASALNCLASSFIMCHNHPSGTLKPSSHDINITEQLKEAGKFLNITILDHLIITPNKTYFSFADESLI